MKSISFALPFVLFAAIVPGRAGEPVYLNREAKLEVEGLEDVTAYIEARNARIWKELNALVDQVRRTGEPVSGLEVKGRYLWVKAGHLPHLIRVETAAYVLSRNLEIIDYAPTIIQELLARGFPFDEVRELKRLTTGENSHFNYTGKFVAGDREFAKHGSFSDKAIKDFILEREAEQWRLQKEWVVQLLSALSLEARRVVLSYIFEFEGRTLGTAYFLPDVETEEIEKWREDLSFIQMQIRRGVYPLEEKQ